MVSPSGALPLCDGGLVCSRRSSACGLGFSRCSSACERSLRVREQCRRVWFPRRLSARGAPLARSYASRPLVHPAVDTIRAQPFEHSISQTPGTWQVRFQKTFCSNLGSLGHANSRVDQEIPVVAPIPPNPKHHLRLSRKFGPLVLPSDASVSRDGGLACSRRSSASGLGYSRCSSAAAVSERCCSACHHRRRSFRARLPRRELPHGRGPCPQPVARRVPRLLPRAGAAGGR